MRHDMDTGFYKKDIAYHAKRIMKLLTNAYGGEWDFKIESDGKTKVFEVFNTTDIEQFGVGKNGTQWRMFWGPTCNSYKMKARTWYELAENVQNMLLFGCVGAKAANNLNGSIEINDLD